MKAMKRNTDWLKLLS